MTDHDPQQPTVSFVVIAHNEAGVIARALRSILAQKGLARREVIVVDDGSSDGTGRVVRDLAREHPEVRLVELERNRGRGFARDTGIRLARAPMIATVDADVILPPDWWSRCVSELAAADAVGGTAVPDGDVAYLYGRFGLTPRGTPHTTTVPGSNAVYRRELFDRVSFDRALRDGEDVALNHDLERIGARVLVVPGLIVEHRETKNLRQTLSWLHQSGRGATRQLYRYRRLRGPDLAFGGWLLSILVAASWWRRGRRASAAVVLGYSGATAAAHVARAFRWTHRDAVRVAGAVLLDVPLLNAYFTGRLLGIGSLIAADER